jgi:hypothetical protein
MGQQRHKTELVLLVFALVILMLAGAIYILSHKGPPPVATAKPPSSEKQPEQAVGKRPGPLGKPLRPSTRNPFGSPLTGGEATPGGPGVTVAPGPPQVGPAAPQVGGFVLVGILKGAQPMAVIREGEKRHEVRVGDRVGEGYVVEAIGEGRVVLAKGGQRVVLKLGGGAGSAGGGERKGP